MTKIIFTKLETDSFRLSQFYLARSRRIIPALVFLCVVLLIGLWWVLPPSEMIRFARQLASSVTFVSNILYWRESGYFDVTSHEKWLLHTWSLSVEWQFYILYPVALLLAKKYSPLLIYGGYYWGLHLPLLRCRRFFRYVGLMPVSSYCQPAHGKCWLAV